MDLFTHVLVAYLVSYGAVGFQPNYLVAGALAGGLPDGDVLFFPISRRFPSFRHHGITHSIFGVTVVALVGGIVAPMIAPGNPLLYFLVMELGGLVHVLQDGFTHFSVPPLLPFSDRRLELDADRAINFVTLGVSVFAFYLLLVVEQNHVPFEYYLLTLYTLSAFFLLYFSLRLAARWRIGVFLRQRKEYSVPVPTGNPLAWLILDERKENGRMRTRFARYVIGRGVTQGPFVVDVPLVRDPGATGPVRTAEDALARSYPIARERSRIFDQTYHFGEAQADGEDGWLAHWYSLEFSAFGRAAGVRVHLPKNGPASARSAWYAPLWRQELT